MNIGEAAARSGVAPKNIRYYESIGLIGPARRAENGYRDYHDTDVQMLNFVNRARGLGFSVKQLAELLSLYQDRGRASADVKAIALDHMAEIEQKIEELQSMHRTLAHLTEKCHGDERPDCPILDDIAGLPGESPGETMSAAE